MAVYTVHEPPLKRDQTAPDPERFVFVRDGFAFWAFVLGPLWMLRHRLWLVMAVVSFLIALLVGLEATTLRRFTLTRRGWKNVGIVVGDDLDAVERRFFDAWVGSPRQDIEPRHAASSTSAVPILRRPQGSLQASPQAPGSSEVIGLFPEPGAPR